MVKIQGVLILSLDGTKIPHVSRPCQKKKNERERERTDILMKYDWGVPQQDAFVVGETVLFKVF